jgi:hypothetical protein
MYSRKQYLNGDCSYRGYYSQFVDDNVKQMVKDRVGIERLKKSTDKNFNDLKLVIWDNVGLPWNISNQLKERGDFMTAADRVCIVKEAARQLLEDELKKR